MSYGERLKDRRKELGLSQCDIALALDVDQAAISNWERGINKPVKKYRKKLAELYGIAEEVKECQE